MIQEELKNKWRVSIDAVPLVFSTTQDMSVDFELYNTSFATLYDDGQRGRLLLAENPFDVEALSRAKRSRVKKEQP